MVNLSYIEFLDCSETSAPGQILYRLDLSGHFVFVDAEGQRLLGYSGEELSQMNISDVVSPELAGLVRRQMARLVDEPVGAVYEIEFVTRNRRRIRLETSFHLVIGNHDQIEIHGIALPPVGRRWPARARCLDANFTNQLIVPDEGAGV